MVLVDVSSSQPNRDGVGQLSHSALYNSPPAVAAVARAVNEFAR